MILPFLGTQIIPAKKPPQGSSLSDKSIFIQNWIDDFGHDSSCDCPNAIVLGCLNSFVLQGNKTELSLVNY